ncbi:hypothetical protein [Ferroplasma acidiphilum]|jgi:hypothetical protein|nr:hypothetical protein [Ferroplasma acidiphilum]
MNKKIVIGVLMVAIFLMATLVPVSNNIQVNNNNNSANIKSANFGSYTHVKGNVIIKFHNIKTLLISLFSHKKLTKVFEYNDVIIKTKSQKINSNEVLALFYIHAHNLNKMVNVTIVKENNEYIIHNKNVTNSLEINNKTGKITYGPGGTYSYYVTNSGKSTHTWHSSISTGTWTACSQTIVDKNTFFMTWNGPAVVLLLGIFPALYLPTSSWHASNNDGWSFYCGGVLGNGKMMPRSGSKTIDDYHGSYTTVKITACWNYGVAGG